MIRILLAQRLGEKRWKQADLVRKTGIRAATINELYNEVADRISLKQINSICEVLDCDVSDLLVREECLPSDVLARLPHKVDR